MNKVSIIMPIYNVGKYLDKSIQSVLSQTYNDFELILINDGSTDHSKEICEKYEEIDVRVKLINQKNQGSGLSRNRGLVESKGTWVYFMDPDDYIDKNLLKDNVKILESDQSDVIFFRH